MIGPATQILNAAKVADGKSRSPFGGAAFTAINALAGATDDGGGLNAATVSSDQLLADLNGLRAAPQLAAAIAAIHRAQQDDAQQSSDPAQRQQLTQQAQKLVSQTFFGTMLKQMRNSPFKSELWSGGRGGEAFHSLMDQHLADRMSRGAGNDLVQSIVRSLEKMSGQYRDAKEANELELNRKPVQPNPYANVRVHVAPTIGS